MINYYNKHRFISKKELARLAGVSERTFCRYIASRRHILEAMGVLPNARLLPPQAVKYVCELHRSARIPAGQGSDQEESCLQESGKELQSATFFDGRWVRVTEIPHDY